MDLNDVDEDEEAAAMAAMMGFSGFGSQKPSAKKRKFATDAFVEGQDVKTFDIGGKQSPGSGGNRVPIGKPRTIGTVSSGKAVESEPSSAVDIDMDDDEIGGPQYVDTSLPPPLLAMEGRKPLYGDTSEPSSVAVSIEEAKEMQSRIDAIIASVEAVDPVQPSAPGTETPFSLPERPNFSPPDTMSGPESFRGASMSSLGIGKSQDAFSDSTLLVSSKHSHRGGPRNEKWYLQYYDPSFIENPWERLEKEKGLKPLGDWGRAQGA